MMTIAFSLPNFSQQLKPENDFDRQVIHFLQGWSSSSTRVSVQTSGSTGTPKIFDIEKEKMRNSANMTCDFLGLKEENSALLCLPIEYISGKMMIVRSIERKLNLRIEKPSLTPLRNLQESIDFCAMTPLQVEHSLDKIHLIKKLIIGGAAVSESLKEKINNQLSILNFQTTIDNCPPTTKIYETYGMSETLSHIALKEIYPKEEEYFTIFEGIEIEQDECGCLKISAPQLNSQTLNTNDLVEIINKKQFRFLGRIDNVINSSGAKIFPEQLEALVKKHIPNEVVFIGIPDEVLGQRLIMTIEGTENDSIKNQLSTINYQLKFHKPKKIVFVNKIPRTLNGKVDRRALLDLLLKCKIKKNNR